MAAIELAPEVGGDSNRTIEQLLQYEVARAGDRINEIVMAISVLESYPLFGRPTKDDMQEPIIGQPSKG